MIVHTSPAAGDAQALDLKENKIQLGSIQKAHGKASTKMSIQEETETSCSHISVDKDVASPKNSKPSRVKRLSKRLSAYLSFIQLSDSEEVVGVVDSTSNGETSSIRSPSKESKSRLLFGLFKGPRSRAMSDSDSLSRKSKDSKPMKKRISLGLDLSSPNSHETEEVTAHSAIRRVSSMPISPFPSAVSPTAYGQNHLYEKLEQLGEGSYATVFKGKSKVNDMFVALKEIRLQEEEGAPFTAIREASLLKQLKHANIVRLHDIIHTNSNLTLVFEYLHTDLCQYLERHPNGINDYNAKIFLFQLLRGLSYIHKRRILHRDLKPQNLLLSEMGDLKLADFGLARSKTVPSRTYSNEVVTLWYRPPDVLCGSKTYSTSLDVWGVGCIFLEMLTGFPLFPGTKGVIDQLEKIWKICGSPDQEWYSKSKYNSFEFAEYLPQQLGLIIPRLTDMFGAEDIAVKMIQCYPEKRITCEQALRHHYFSDLPKEVYVLPDTTSIISVEGVALQLEANRLSHQDPSRNGPRDNSSSGGRFFV